MIRTGSDSRSPGLHADFRGANERPRTDGGFMPAEGPYLAAWPSEREERRTYGEAPPAAANDG